MNTQQLLIVCAAFLVVGLPVLWWARRRSRRAAQEFLEQHPNAAVLYIYAQDILGGGRGQIACQCGTASQPVSRSDAPGFGVSRGDTAYYLAPGYVEFDATLSWTRDYYFIAGVIHRNHELQTHLSLQAEPGCGYAVVFDRKNERAKIIQLEKQNAAQKKKSARVKVARKILGILCLALLGGMWYFLSIANPKAEITINDVTYQMGAVVMRDFMADGYTFSDPRPNYRTPNYATIVLAARTYDNWGYPFRPKDGSGSPISCWVYNPTSKSVGIRDGMICAISCKMSECRKNDITVSVVGLELVDQTKEEIKSYIEETLPNYTFSENEDYNSISYKQGNVSYTFVFNEKEILQSTSVRFSRW